MTVCKRDVAYAPDVVFPPGETLLEVLENRGMSQDELAKRINRSTKVVSDLVSGKERITNAMARELEPVLGVPFMLWVNLQHAYDRFLARRHRPSS